LKQFVLDASVSLAWFVDDPIPDLAIRVKNSLQNGSSALVPALWHLEMANGFALAERRRALTPAVADRCLDDVEELLNSVIESSSRTVSLREAHAVARTFGLTAYDAVYLETALREHLALATLDRGLGRAAVQAGVPIVQ
jgi:predicted nucleic acid-binding protein